LEAAFTEGYAVARSVAFYERPVIQALFWARFPGDTLLILGTAVFCYDVVRKRFRLGDVTTAEDAREGAVPQRVLGEDDD
jgi:nitric oxide reductase subunit B